MTSVQRWSRVVIGMALLLMVPAYFAVRLHLDTERAARNVPGVGAALDKAIAGLEGRPLTCFVDPPRPERLSREDALDLVNRPASALYDLNYNSFNDDDLLWLLDSGLPLTGRAQMFRDSAMALDEQIDKLEDLAGATCQGTYYTVAEVEQEEARGQKELVEGFARLREPRAQFATAWAALDEQRPVLGVVAWSLGLLELVGWALLFVNLPRDLRTLRAKRAERRGKTETK